MFFNKYFFAKVGRRKHTGKFLMLQFYKSLLQFYKKKTRKSPVYKAVRAILLSKVIYIFLPSLSIRALFKKPICTFLYYCYITYSLPAAPCLPAFRPCGRSSRHLSASAWLPLLLWERCRPDDVAICHSVHEKRRFDGARATCLRLPTRAYDGNGLRNHSRDIRHTWKVDYLTVILSLGTK